MWSDREDWTTTVSEKRISFPRFHRHYRRPEGSEMSAHGTGHMTTDVHVHNVPRPNLLTSSPDDHIRATLLWSGGAHLEKEKDARSRRGDATTHCSFVKNVRILYKLLKATHSHSCYVSQRKLSGAII